MSFKRIIPAAVALSMLAGTTAFAAAQTATGAIKSIDAKQATITLADGQIYQLPKNFDAKSLKKGEKVSVTFDKTDGKMVASQVKPM